MMSWYFKAAFKDLYRFIKLKTLTGSRKYMMYQYVSILTIPLKILVQLGRLVDFLAKLLGKVGCPVQLGVVGRHFAIMEGPVGHQETSNNDPSPFLIMVGILNLAVASVAHLKVA